MPPEVEYSLNPRIGMDLIDSLSNREVSVRQRVDQENVGCFMTKAKERELHGRYISSETCVGTREVGMQVFAGACGNFPRRRWLSRPACRPAGGKWSDRHRTQRPLPSAGQRLLCVLLLDSTMATATRCRTEGCTTSTTSTLATCSVIPKIHVCLLLHAVLFTTAKRRKMSSTMSTSSHNSNYHYAQCPCLCSY